VGPANPLEKKKETGFCYWADRQKKKKEREKGQNVASVLLSGSPSKTKKKEVGRSAVIGKGRESGGGTVEGMVREQPEEGKKKNGERKKTGLKKKPS